MKLYHMPNSCSLGIHVLLGETGQDFEIGKIDLKTGEQLGEAFRARNPKAKVPALELDDGTIVTEWPAIAYYLAETYPDAKLMPEGLMQRVRAFEVTDFCVATIHMQGFSRIARPGNFAPDEAEHDKVQQRGREIMAQGFDVLAQRIQGPYLLGEFCFADAALFYVEHWAVNRAGMNLPAACRAHLDKMMERPSVRRMIEADQIPVAA